ncbi:MAG: OB-fold nucleic acid binding domain-containing protein, partial [Clostridia bacterium]
MKDVLIKDLYRNLDKYIDKEISVSGWVRTLRDSKNFGFIEINDGSFFKNIQIVFDNTLENFTEICKLSISSSLTVIGKVVETNGAKQPFELKASKVDIIDVSDPSYPLQKKRHSFEYLRTI